MWKVRLIYFLAIVNSASMNKACTLTALNRSCRFTDILPFECIKSVISGSIGQFWSYPLEKPPCCSPQWFSRFPFPPTMYQCSLYRLLSIFSLFSALQDWPNGSEVAYYSFGWMSLELGDVKHLCI